MSTQVTITDADLAALIQKLTVAASKLCYAADQITAVIPVIQGDVKVIADRVSAAQVNVNDALADIRVDASAIATAIKNFRIL